MSHSLPLILVLTMILGLRQADAKEPIPVSQKTDLSAENPFSRSPELPLKTLDFKAYQPKHFQPAMIAGMKRQLEEISVITANDQPATFELSLIHI